LSPTGRRSFGCEIPRAGGARGEGRREEAEELFTGDEEFRAAVNGAVAGFL
jgi:hypothetical protein